MRTLSASQLAFISFGACILTILLVASVPLALFAFPVTAGERSYFHSLAWPWLLGSSFLAQVLGPVAWVCGVKALRRTSSSSGLYVRALAWTGSIVGSVWTLLSALVWVLGFVVLAGSRV